MDLSALVTQCAPSVHPTVMSALISVESSHNPYAIGVVGGQLARQPKSLDEAVAAVKKLRADGRNFSMGVAQINKVNLAKYGLTDTTVFDACANIAAGAKILTTCYVRATPVSNDDYQALGKALSCYYSGNFITGFKSDFKGQLPYVVKVMNRLGAPILPQKMVVPLPLMPQTQDVQVNAQAVADDQPVMLKVSGFTSQTVAKSTQSWDRFSEF